MRLKYKLLQIALSVTIAFSWLTILVTSGASIFAQAQQDVTISAEVSSCILDLRVLPEKRIPSINNWQTLLTVRIHQAGSGSQIANFSATSNSFGTATVNLCNLGIFLSNGNYDFYIKGKSHLFKLYPNINAFTSATSTIDLSSEGLLLAGETSVVFDNYINVLDISSQITQIFTISDLHDLNQDGLVNVLDISNTVTNYLLIGD